MVLDSLREASVADVACELLVQSGCSQGSVPTPWANDIAGDLDVVVRHLVSQSRRCFEHVRKQVLRWLIQIYSMTKRMRLNIRGCPGPSYMSCVETTGTHL